MAELAGSLADSALLRALGALAPWMLAWLGVAAIAALRRRSFLAPGASGAWLPLIAGVALVVVPLPWPMLGEGAGMEPERAADRAPGAPWSPAPISGGTLLSAASWRELQARLLEARGAPVPIRIEPAAESGAVRVPAGWHLPSGARVALDGAAPAPLESSASSAWSLAHAGRAYPQRALQVGAAPSPGVEPQLGELVLELRAAQDIAWREVARASAAGERALASFDLVAPEPGTYALRVFDPDSREELARSALVVLPSPRVRALGSGLAALLAALRAQGYTIVEGGTPETGDALVVVGEGADAALADPGLVRYVEDGGGLWLATPAAWETAQAQSWSGRLPARLLPEIADEERESAPREEERPLAEPPPEAAPQPEESNAGRFALFIVLDLSGSFADALTEAWDQIAASLRAAEGFELLGIAGFNVEGRLLLPLAAHGAALDRELEAQRAELQRYVREGGRQTYLTPALRLAAAELAREQPAGALLVVVSDGIFDDRPEQGGDWQRFVQSDLVLKSGYALAAIRIADPRLPTSALQGGLRRMDRIAEMGGTRKAVLRSDLGSALRVIPVVAREVQTASAWQPRRPGGAPPSREESPPKGESEPEPGPEPSAPLIPTPTGLHAAEGEPGELDGAPWPALRELRRCLLGPAAAPAWLVDPRREPLLATGVLGAGRIATSAASLEEASWPGAARDPRFPLFAARIADQLRRAEEPARAIRARVRRGATAVEPSDGAEELDALLRAAAADLSLEALRGSLRRDEAWRVESTLRAAAPVAWEGERALAEVLATHLAPAPTGGATLTGRPTGGDSGTWLAAFGFWLAVALAIEAACGILARARRGAR